MGEIYFYIYLVCYTIFCDYKLQNLLFLVSKKGDFNKGWPAVFSRTFFILNAFSGGVFFVGWVLVVCFWFCGLFSWLVGWFLWNMNYLLYLSSPYHGVWISQDLMELYFHSVPPIKLLWIWVGAIATTIVPLILKLLKIISFHSEIWKREFKRMLQIDLRRMAVPDAAIMWKKGCCWIHLTSIMCSSWSTAFLAPTVPSGSVGTENGVKHHALTSLHSHSHNSQKLLPLG